MIVGRVVGAVFSFSRSVCMSVYSAGISRVLIKYSGKYVKIYFNMKITFFKKHRCLHMHICTYVSIYTHTHIYMLIFSKRRDILFLPVYNK